MKKDIMCLNNNKDDSTLGARLEDEEWETIRKLENMDLYEITFSNQVKKTVGFEIMADLVNQRTMKNRPSGRGSSHINRTFDSDDKEQGGQLLEKEKDVDPTENAKSFGRSSSKYFGVSWHSQRKRWRAYIYLSPGRQKYLGTFEDQVDAALAYDRAVQAHSLRSPLNFGVNLSAKNPKQKKRQLSVFKRREELKAQAALQMKAENMDTSKDNIFPNRARESEWKVKNTNTVVPKRPKVHGQQQGMESLVNRSNTGTSQNLRYNLSTGSMQQPNQMLPSGLHSQMTLPPGLQPAVPPSALNFMQQYQQQQHILASHAHNVNTTSPANPYLSISHPTNWTSTNTLTAEQMEQQRLLYALQAQQQSTARKTGNQNNYGANNFQPYTK